MTGMFCYSDIFLNILYRKTLNYHPKVVYKKREIKNDIAKKCYKPRFDEEVVFDENSQDEKDDSHCSHSNQITQHDLPFEWACHLAVQS